MPGARFFHDVRRWCTPNLPKRSQSLPSKFEVYYARAACTPSPTSALFAALFPQRSPRREAALSRAEGEAHLAAAGLGKRVWGHRPLQRPPTIGTKTDASALCMRVNERHDVRITDASGARCLLTRSSISIGSDEHTTMPGFPECRRTTLAVRRSSIWTRAYERSQ